MANTPKISVKVVDKIAEDLLLGMSVEYACASAGVSYEASWLWEKEFKDKELAWLDDDATIPDNPDRDWLLRYWMMKKSNALADLQRDLLAEMRAHTVENGDIKAWTRIGWLLERKFPKEFGRVWQKVESKENEASVNESDDQESKELGKRLGFADGDKKE